ncbi:MAG: DUF1345 domain-containing protein [Chthoniobacterales bacterium]
MFKLLSNLDAHQRVLTALAVACIVFLASFSVEHLPFRIILTWNAFAVTGILLAWLRIILADAKTAVANAKLQDTSRSIIFGIVLLGACGSLFAVAYLLGTAKSVPGTRQVQHVALAAITVICSWFLIHTIFALHYAHAFYRQIDEGGDRGDGLNFPGCDEPDFLDFAYFSFVIGMTFQVSDVSITSNRIRRISLVHAMLSFLFNTIILALAINLASGLVQ